MSLTSEMRSLRMDIDNGHKIRQDYIRSTKRSTSNMVANYTKIRVQNSVADKKQRMLDLNELKTEVNNMKNCFSESRKIMGDNTKQALDCFMNDLRADVCGLLKSYRNSLALVRQDIEDAKKEWNNVKKKV